MASPTFAQTSDQSLPADPWNGYFGSSGWYPVLAEMSGQILKTQDVPTRIHLPFGGAVSRALMVRTTDDLDKAQATMDKVMADDTFGRLLPRLIECVDGSKTEDSLWREEVQ